MGLAVVGVEVREAEEAAVEAEEDDLAFGLPPLTGRRGSLALGGLEVPEGHEVVETVYVQVRLEAPLGGCSGSWTRALSSLRAL